MVETNTLEFNSNIAVLERTNQIINTINATRYYLFNPKSAETPPTIQELVLHLIALYKEISVELTSEEDEIWEKLKEMREVSTNKKKALDQDASEFNHFFWTKIINRLDDLDLELRRLAKKHGFLSKNAPVKGKSIMEM